MALELTLQKHVLGKFNYSVHAILELSDTLINKQNEKSSPLNNVLMSLPYILMALCYAVITL